MELEIGAILEGKVTGITKFGAFVSLPDGKSGLVHISEVANTYVNEISEHLTEGQEVKVKLIGIADNGKINLSIKKAEEPKRVENHAPRRNFTPRPSARPVEKREVTFEDKLKQFMQDSDNRMSGNKLYDRKGSSRKRRA